MFIIQICVHNSHKNTQTIYVYIHTYMHTFKDYRTDRQAGSKNYDNKNDIKIERKIPVLFLFLHECMKKNAFFY